MSKRISSLLLIFIALVTVVFFLESIIIAPHSKYGFADVDWGFLYSYKELGELPLLKVFQVWKKWGVYTYQAYYMGIVEHFFPIDNFNFAGIQQVTNFFKFLSAITLFPLILVLTGKRLLSVVTTILYSVAYPTFGPIYAAAVSGNYPAIAVMNLFLAYYIYMVKSKKNELVWLGIGIFLFLLTLFLSTERMYPLIPFLILGELLWVWSQKFSKLAIKYSIGRTSIYLAPLVILFAVKVLGGSSPFGDVAGFFPNTKDIVQKISEGNWSVALNPLIAFGSLFLPREYWGLVGSPVRAMNSFTGYLGFFFGPFSAFLIFIAFLSILIAKKPLRFIGITALLAVILGVLVFLLASHHLLIDKVIRLNFDSMFISPALVGAFVLSLSLSSLIEWVLRNKEEHYSLYFFIGPAMAFFFIFLTWLAAAWNLIFEGVHRYLAIPAIGSSFFIALLIGLFYEKVSKTKALHRFSWLILLIIIPIIQLDFDVVGRYFNKELYFVGMDGPGQIRMKSKLLSYMGDFNLNDPILVYFDEQDYENGYFDETAVIAGFDTWIAFKGKSNPLPGRHPRYVRNNSLCVQKEAQCYKKLAEFVTRKDGVKGLMYGGVFYSTRNFYAFRLKNQDVLDIRNEVVNSIDLN